MKKTIKLLVICLVACWAMSMTAYAQEPVDAQTSFTSSASSGMSETSVTINVNSQEMLEIYENLISNDELCEGEIRVLDVQGGEKFCVEVTEVNVANSVYTTSDTTTTTKIFTFYKENIFGIRKDLFEVRSECTWIRGSRIVRLRCTYTTLASGVSCSWNDNYNSATDLLHTLALDVTYSGNSYFLIFGASLSFDLQTLTLDCSADHEL